MTVLAAPEHPAKWSKALGPIVRTWLRGYTPILDPLAGVGAIDLPGLVCGELEPEWARQCPHPTFVGNALCMPFRRASVAAALTSVAFGNRMSDHHDARERCKACGATGRVPGPSPDGVAAWERCRPCDGRGYRTYRRNTYRHLLGRPLHPDNSGQLPWGGKYQEFHIAFLQELLRVLRPGAPFVLNVSNHYRGKVEQDVVGWFRTHMEDTGWELERKAAVRTPRNRFGANRDLRASHEWLLLWRRP